MRPHEEVATAPEAASKANSHLVDVSKLSFAEFQQAWVNAHMTREAVAEYQHVFRPRPEQAPVVITENTSDAELMRHAARLAHDLGLATGGRLFVYFVLDLQRQIDVLKQAHQ
jgi:hypothetical protein